MPALRIARSLFPSPLIPLTCVKAAIVVIPYTICASPIRHGAGRGAQE
jgi:hypothetical protein